MQTGAIPAAVQPLVTGLPVTEQFGAKMMLPGATQFDISITLAIAAAYGWSNAQLTAFWTAAAL